MGGTADSIVRGSKNVCSQATKSIAEYAHR